MICQVVKVIMDKKKIRESLEFIDNLKANSLKTPNKFTIKMGRLIREAREECSWSQSDLAEKINRRPATISFIENGKSDISVQTLLVLAIVLGKPISYFFPQSLLKDIVMDVKSEEFAPGEQGKVSLTIKNNAGHGLVEGFGQQ